MIVCYMRIAYCGQEYHGNFDSEKSAYVLIGQVFNKHFKTSGNIESISRNDSGVSATEQIIFVSLEEEVTAEKMNKVARYVHLISKANISIVDYFVSKKN